MLEYFPIVLLWRAWLWCRSLRTFFQSDRIRMNNSPCIIHLRRIQFSVKILKKNNNGIILELMKSTNRSIDHCSFFVIWFICCLVSSPKLEYNPTFNKLSWFRHSILWFCLFRFYRLNTFVYKCFLFYLALLRTRMHYLRLSIRIAR